MLASYLGAIDEARYGHYSLPKTLPCGWSCRASHGGGHVLRARERLATQGVRQGFSSPAEGECGLLEIYFVVLISCALISAVVSPTVEVLRSSLCGGISPIVYSVPPTNEETWPPIF